MKVNRLKMCKGKVSFTTISAAKKIATKYDQRVYECPICFCFHCTSSEDWKMDYYTKEEVHLKLNEQKHKIDTFESQLAARDRKIKKLIKLHTQMQKKLTEKNLKLAVRNKILSNHGLLKELQRDNGTE